MARILVLQEIPGPQKALRRSLEPHHLLFFVKNINEALTTLHTNDIDLIISRVHLERTSVFEFIRKVKTDPELAAIPFICFCGKRSEAAKLMNRSIEKACVMIGADKYLSFEQFCQSDVCDFDRLRSTIENQLPVEITNGLCSKNDRDKGPITGGQSRT